MARDGIDLPFVWILMACLGGFEVLGLVGLFVGPVVLALARELWDQRIRDLDRAQAGDIRTRFIQTKASHAPHRFRSPRHAKRADLHRMG